MKLKHLAFLGLLCAPLYGASLNNRGVPREDVADRNWTADDRFLVRFTTTVAANTSACIVSTGTFNLLVVSTGVSTSPTILSSSTVTYGGRAHMLLQIVDAASYVAVDFRSVDISTTTSPRLTQGTWFSPDDPIAWQGEVYMKSVSSFTVTGWMWFDRPRSP